MVLCFAVNCFRHSRHRHHSGRSLRHLPAFKEPHQGHTGHPFHFISSKRSQVSFSVGNTSLKYALFAILLDFLSIDKCAMDRFAQFLHIWIPEIPKTLYVVFGSF
jgi:hypothetical protein